MYGCSKFYSNKLSTLSEEEGFWNTESIQNQTFFVYINSLRGLYK